MSLGGDYAGLSATFNPCNGKYIPIPDRLVPNELIQWGQEPKCLQILVSEDLYVTSDHKHKDGKDEESNEQATTTTTLEMLKRTTTSILPAIGCDLDNHQTIKSTEKIDLLKQNAIIDTGSSDVIGLQYHTPGDDKNSIRLETIFKLLDKEGQTSYRMRVILDVYQSESTA